MKPFLVVNTLSNRSNHHTIRVANDDFSLHRLHLCRPYHRRPRSDSHANASGDGSLVGAAIDGDKLNLLPPQLPGSQLGPKPPNSLHDDHSHHRTHSHHEPHGNRCPCGERFVRREFYTPGVCRFHAKAAVAVNAPATATTTTSWGSSHQRLQQPLPYRRRRNRWNYDKSGGSVNAKLLLLGRGQGTEGRAAALPEGATEGVRGCAPGHYSPGRKALRNGRSGGVTGGASR